MVTSRTGCLKSLVESKYRNREPQITLVIVVYILCVLVSYKHDDFSNFFVLTFVARFAWFMNCKNW